MAYAPTQLAQDPQYERFLFAPVGEDQRGTSVTVLSMLARLGVDPWGEASDLAKLPEGAARQRLDALLGRFSDVQILVADRGRIVAKLLTFLPRQTTSAKSPGDGPEIGIAFPPRGSPLYWIIAAAVLVGWIAMLAQGQ